MGNMTRVDNKSIKIIKETKAPGGKSLPRFRGYSALVSSTGGFLLHLHSLYTHYLGRCINNSFIFKALYSIYHLPTYLLLSVKVGLYCNVGESRCIGV